MRKYKRLIELLKYGYIFFTFAVIVGGKNYVEAQVISPLPNTPDIAVVFSTPAPTPKPAVDIRVDKSKWVESEITNYIKKIFPDVYKTAIAIAWAECGFNPNCKNYTARETSVGLYQINLKAHWDKVPGNTFEEKEAYLLNPFNNVLVARVIYLESNWYPWSSFTNQSYLKFL